MENNLRVLMAMRKKTLTDVHKETGISMATLSGLYHETSENPQSKTLIKLADYFGVTYSELLNKKMIGVD